MEIFVDGIPQEISLDGGETVGDVVGSVSKTLDTKKRIVKVVLNGENITGVSQKHLDPALQSMRIEIVTGFAKELATESLESISEFHASLLKEFKRSAEEFRMGSFEASSNILANCIDGLQILMKTTMSVTSLLQIAPENISAGEMNLAETVVKIAEVLEEMIQAQTNHDGILIADLIEYEITPLVEDWGIALDTMKNAGVTA